MDAKEVKILLDLQVAQEDLEHLFRRLEKLDTEKKILKERKKNLRKS